MNGAGDGTYNNTMTHEIAHAIVGPNHGHDQVWTEKHLEMGGDGQPCGHFTIDATRGTDKSEQRPKVHIKPLTNVCPHCGKTAIEVSRATFPSGVTFIKLQCGHLVQKDKLASLDVFSSWTSATGKKMYPYQVEGAKFIEQANGRCLIAD